VGWRTATSSPKTCCGLWANAGRTTIALADFGLSRDLGAALESTRIMMPGGTAAYAAPEAGTPGWAETPWAGDVWALGIMAIEIAAGARPVWTGRRLEAAGEPERGALGMPPSGGAAAQDFASLALSALAVEPAARPSADELLLHPFFAAAEAAPDDAAGPSLGGCSPALAAKLGALAVGARADAGGAPFLLELPAVAADAAWAHAFLSAVGAAPPAALTRPWAVRCGGARQPLSAAMRAFWAAAPAAPGLLSQSAPRVDLPFLPCTDADRAPDACFDALGRILARCLLEGLAVDLEFAPTVYAALLGREAAAVAAPGHALAHLAAWDEAAAAQHRATLASRLGAGSELLTVDTYLSNGDETLLCDALKRDVIVAAIARQLVGRRRGALDALRSGFGAVAEAAGLAPALVLLDEWELGAYLSGAGAGAGTDGEELRRRVAWDDTWPAADPQRAWLDATLAALSEPALRQLLARTAGRLRPPAAGPTLLVVRRAEGDADDAPRLVGNGILELAASCPSPEALTARLLRVLGLRAAAAEAGADEVDARRLRGEQRDAFAALRAAGAVRPGAVFACPNGHLYAVGECGGPMQRATCPECGAAIGGEDHRAAAGNVARPDVDGAAAPAWPPNG
jgi:hypothetical protein